MMKTAAKAAAVAAAAVLCPPAAGMVTVGSLIKAGEYGAQIVRAIKEFDGDCTQWEDEEE